MNSHKNRVFLALGLISLFALSACVTTRQQLNEERGIGPSAAQPPIASQNTVQSEDLSPKVAEPAASAPQSPPATAPAPATGPSADAPGPQPIAPAAVSGGGYTIEEIRAEMARLSGKVEELEHEKRMREEARTEEQKKLQEKIGQLEKQLQEAPAAKGPLIPEGKTPFEAGKDAYFNERYEEAIAFMDQTLATQETGKKAEEAFYLQGESYFKLKNYQKAIVNYSKFPERFPKSQYHSKSLLRIAECFESMGMKEDAKAFYQNLADQFPKTAEGKLAKKRLAPPKKK